MLKINDSVSDFYGFYYDVPKTVCIKTSSVDYDYDACIRINNT